jgi:thermitase
MLYLILMFRLTAVFVLILSLILTLTTLQPQVKAQGKPDHVSGTVLVKFKEATTLEDVDSEVRKNSGRVVDKINALDTYILKVPEAQEERVAAALSKNPKVEYAETDSYSEAFSFPLTAPDDTSYLTKQWGLENTGQTIVNQVGATDKDIDAQTAWQYTLGDGIKVAVLDTGIDQDHPDLVSKVALQRNFTSSDVNAVNDFYGHGTHVSGIVGAITNNSTGVAGVCPGCRLLNGKVLNDSGSGANSWIANGIIWATDNGAKVINMSLGGPTKSTTLENAVNYAWNHGVVVVAAAGNSGNPSKTYPGAYKNVIAVASTNNLDKKSSFSSYGSWVDVAAPGENIFSTFPTHNFYIQSEYGRSLNYDYGSGTSMATPMVSATAALIWSTPKYGSSAASVRARLENTSEKIPGTGSYWISGRINAGAAVTP